MTTSALATIPTSEVMPLDQNAAAVYIASLGMGSRRTMHTALKQIAKLVTGNADPFSLNWGQLHFQHTAALRAQLVEMYSSGNAKKHIDALRGVLKAARRLGQMSAEDYARAVDLPAIRGTTLPRGRALTGGEIAALLEACSNDPSADGARDAAVIALMRVGGLRRAEVCKLTIGDYDSETGALRIEGKGNKQRLCYVSDSAADALTDWLNVRGTEPGALFHPITKGGTIERRAMSAQAIYDVLAKRAREAGVKNLSPHDFRRTFASDLLDAGADISTVKNLMGHANVQTTARYDRRGTDPGDHRTNSAPENRV